MLNKIIFLVLKFEVLFYFFVSAADDPRKRTVQCKVCLKLFSTSGALFTHKTTHLGKIVIVLQIFSNNVQERFLSGIVQAFNIVKNRHDYYFRRILRAKYTSSVLIADDKDPAKYRFPCDQCDKRFSSAANLRKHLLVHGEPSLYSCTPGRLDNCSKTGCLNFTECCSCCF